MHRPKRFEGDSTAAKESCMYRNMGDEPNRPRRWPSWLGWAILVLTTIERVVGLGGSIDFIVSRSRDPDWVGEVLRFIADQRDTLSFLFVVVGFGLILWNHQRRVNATITALRTDFILRAESPSLSNELEALKQRVQDLSDFPWKFNDKIESLTKEVRRLSADTEATAQLEGAIGAIMGIEALGPAVFANPDEWLSEKWKETDPKIRLIERHILVLRRALSGFPTNTEWSLKINSGPETFLFHGPPIFSGREPNPKLYPGMYKMKPLYLAWEAVSDHREEIISYIRACASPS
jgi:hypothetical protein